MLKNYILVGFRNLKKQKVFTLINVLGLAVGMAFFAFFAQRSGTKSNADRFHKNGRRIHAVVQVLETEEKDESHGAFLQAPLLPALRAEFAEIEDGTRALKVSRLTVRRGDDSFYDVSFLFVDPSFLDIFSFKTTAGNRETMLDEPFSIVLSEDAAYKYFGDSNPIGEVLTLNNEVQMKVTGIVENQKGTSSIRFRFLVPFEAARSLFDDLDTWSSHKVGTFLLLPPKYDAARFDEKLSDFIVRHYPDAPESPKRMYLFPFMEMRLHANHIQTLVHTSWPAAMIIVLAIGVLMLLIVSINFINLTVARHMHRTLEVGVRKVVGARRGQLVRQLLGESLMMSFLALPLGIVFYELLHPMLNAYLGMSNPVSGVTQTISDSIFNYPFLLRYMVVAALLTGLFSGLYPALFLSSFKPVEILSGRVKKQRRKGRGRRAMIVIQFSLSIILIAAAGVIKNQSTHFFEADLGYERDHVAAILVNGVERSDLDVLYTEIAHHPGVVSVSASAELPIVWEEKQPVRKPGDDPETAIESLSYGVDYGFVETIQIDMKEGRTLSREAGDRNAFILNEAAVAKYGLENPIGQTLVMGDRTGTVIGVARDYVFEDIGFELKPAVLFLQRENLSCMVVRFLPSAVYSEIYDRIKSVWQEVLPEVPLHCETLEEHYGKFFGLLIRMAGLFNILGIIAVLFSCLGLFGLSHYVVERRTKEIGIRKVLGAPVFNVGWNLIREFLILVVIANGIAFPIIFYAWQKVIQTGLMLVTQINPGTYLFAGGLSLLTTVLAVSSQTYKAVRSNPVDSLRYE